MSDSMTWGSNCELTDAGAVEVFNAPRKGSIRKEQGLVLLARLINDAAFRARFEQAPAQALVEIGVTAEQLATLDQDCFAPKVLASAAELRAARERLANDVDHRLLSFIFPAAKFTR